VSEQVSWVNEFSQNLILVILTEYAYRLLLISVPSAGYFFFLAKLIQKVGFGGEGIEAYIKSAANL
jgi:hypothetical protein